MTADRRTVIPQVDPMTLQPMSVDRLASIAKVTQRHVEAALENYITVPELGCWIWLGTWDAYGYGITSWKKSPLIKAHRIFYTFHHGDIPSGMVVCHKCDTRSCVNPNHLFIGTQRDNVKDMMKKGRRHKNHINTHCNKGHAMDEKNTYFYMCGGYRKRRCRKCNSICKKIAYWESKEQP